MVVMIRYILICFLGTIRMFAFGGGGPHGGQAGGDPHRGSVGGVIIAGRCADRWEGILIEGRWEESSLRVVGGDPHCGSVGKGREVCRVAGMGWGAEVVRGLPPPLPLLSRLPRLLLSPSLPLAPATRGVHHGSATMKGF